MGTPTNMMAPPMAVCTAPPMRLGFFFETRPSSMIVALTAACAASFPYDGARNVSLPDDGAWVAHGLLAYGGVRFRAACLLRLYGLREPHVVRRARGYEFVTVR